VVKFFCLHRAYRVTKNSRHICYTPALVLVKPRIAQNTGIISLISLFLAGMQEETTTALLTEEHSIESRLLQRTVIIECFLPTHVTAPENMGLLLINDGQDMKTLGLAPMLESLLLNNQIEPLLCVAIHSCKDRKMEYGTAATPDYLGRGARAGLYTRFIFEELLPFIQASYGISSFKEKSFAGFSLGGLSALDIVWSHPEEFSTAGVFSGSLWWRSRALDDGYNEDTDRIMHRLVREGSYYPGLKFFFETGALDETMDRNNNGIIDAIDDTLGLMDELIAKGYSPHDDIHYLELGDGKHDVPTWARAMPVFLQWRWGK
jgi:enterochelin esterase-like enzyme